MRARFVEIGQGGLSIRSMYGLCKGHRAGFARTTLKSSSSLKTMLTHLQLFILDGKIEQVNENPRSFGDLSDHLVLFNHQVRCGAECGVRDHQFRHAAHAPLSCSPLLNRRTTRCWLLGSTAAGATGLSARPPPETRSSFPTSSSPVGCAYRGALWLRLCVCVEQAVVRERLFKIVLVPLFNKPKRHF